MFPTLLWNVQIKAELHQVMDAKILTLLATMRRELPALARGQGWQSRPALQQSEELGGLVTCVANAGRSVLRVWNIGANDIEITGCWANVLAAGAAHKVHSHPNNFLSGVYYLQVQPGADTVNFHDPRSQTGIISPPVTALTAENTDQVVVSLRNGTLLLFPSYLQHSVDANTSDRERISISFNLMFTSFTQNMSKPLW